MLLAVGAGLVPFEDVLILVHDTQDGPGLFLFASGWIVKRSAQADLLAGGIGRAFAVPDHGTHGIHPQTDVFLLVIVVARQAQPLERLSHDRAFVLLLQETSPQNPFLLRS